ncbi:hypothetical protein Dgeo_2535 (plasmid) [Deinococcus geothermalis DSM 11300]|uniref:Uncharacterized protein n=1 Tax=Deinococcus geothermalis (strain DSM 11300 / CIP 105573 / AG-3a) TaxID=319795 RepID=Q1J3G5_DEIGD|nr:hypothetical protein Dgeo_2535 [Deinococcus geothermalis DSM 11300]
MFKEERPAKPTFGLRPGCFRLQHPSARLRREVIYPFVRRTHLVVPHVCNRDREQSSPIRSGWGRQDELEKTCPWLFTDKVFRSEGLKTHVRLCPLAWFGMIPQGNHHPRPRVARPEVSSTLRSPSFEEQFVHG